MKVRLSFEQETGFDIFYITINFLNIRHTL